MGDDKPVKLESSFLEWGTKLKALLVDQQSEIAEGTSKRLSHISEAQNVLLAVLGSVHARADRTVAIADLTAKLHRAAIHAAIIQGIESVGAAISEARYVQSAALIRQEFEAVEACEGLRSKRQKEGNTPKLKVLKHLGKHYGILSSLAHLSRSDYLLNLYRVAENGIDPKLSGGVEKELFCIHLTALVGICIDAAELRPFSDENALSPQEEAWLISVCGILASEGYLSGVRG